MFMVGESQTQLGWDDACGDEFSINSLYSSLLSSICTLGDIGQYNICSGRCCCDNMGEQLDNGDAEE
jgi:hypothetical protein